MEELLVRVEEGICTISLNRPAARNALTAAMRLELISLVTSIDADETVAVVVITGTDPAFCAGIDLQEIAAGEATDAIPALRAPDAGVEQCRDNLGTAVGRMRTPVVAAVNGACYTGGLELALACDVIVASDRATFADTHARFGLAPYWGMSARLPARVGPGRARLMALTGRPVPAAEAERMGLVDLVVPHDDLAATVAGIAADIASAVPSAIAAAQRLYDASADLPLSGRLHLEMEVAEGFRFDRDEFARRVAARTRR